MSENSATPLAIELLNTFCEKKLRLTCAESCSGGGLCQIITSLPGSSEVFDRGFITYSDQSKIQLVNVPENTLRQHGAVSKETAIAMAIGALANSQADIAISITGIAGPSGGSPHKPVGTVWLGLAKKESPSEAQLFHFEGGRRAIQDQTIHSALLYLLNNTHRQ